MLYRVSRIFISILCIFWNEPSLRPSAGSRPCRGTCISFAIATLALDARRQQSDTGLIFADSHQCEICELWQLWCKRKKDPEHSRSLDGRVLLQNAPSELSGLSKHLEGDLYFVDYNGNKPQTQIQRVRVNQTHVLFECDKISAFYMPIYWCVPG